MNDSKPFQIDFSNRLVDDTGNDCLLSCDGVDYRIAISYLKEFHSFKFKKSALRYEVALCIKTGWICHWYGPFEPGMYNDEMIFKMGLALCLEDGERVETDRGYRGSAPSKVKCPGHLCTDPEQEKMTAHVRSRQETINKRMKQWNILVAPYRHDIHEHQNVFAAVAVITQLSIEREPLFSVEYDDCLN